MREIILGGKQKEKPCRLVWQEKSCWLPATIRHLRLDRKGPDTDINLHCFSDGCPEIKRILGFRDRLRASEGDRLLSEQAKRELAARTWRHVQNYADAKTAVVEEILARVNKAVGRCSFALA